MNRQAEHADAFRRLHVTGNPLVLFNAWDAGSARAVADAGARAIATSSWAMAAANGEADGERLPLPQVLETVRRVARSVDLPVSADLESGYADAADGVGTAAAALIAAGAVGCNLEDGMPGAGRMRAPDDQAARLRAARVAAQGAGFALFLNARTDLFLLAPPERHADAMPEALARAEVYAGAGADGLFVPGLVDPELVAGLAQASPLPLNVMIGEGSPDPGVLAAAGAARVSYGPVPYLRAMKALEEAARTVLAP